MAERICCIEGCEKPEFNKGHGWCAMHYSRWRAHGDPHVVLRRVLLGPWQRRFEAFTLRTDSCWLWTNTIDSDGYARTADNGKRAQVHRLIYELVNGPIPDGLTVDHLCRVRHCVNPDHLEAVTRGENVLRGEGISAQNARKTHCKRGHEFTPENTHIRRDGSRQCRPCHAEYVRTHKKGR